MSTGNYELGAFDRAIQQSTTNKIIEQGQAVLATTIYHWLCR